MILFSKVPLWIHNVFVPGIKLFSLRFVPPSFSLPALLCWGAGKTGFCFASCSGMGSADGWWGESAGLEDGEGALPSSVLPVSFPLLLLLPVPSDFTQWGFSTWPWWYFAVAAMDARLRFSWPVESDSSHPVRNTSILSLEVQVTGRRSDTATWV